MTSISANNWIKWARALKAVPAKLLLLFVVFLLRHLSKWEAWCRGQCQQMFQKLVQRSLAVGVLCLLCSHISNITHTHTQKHSTGWINTIWRNAKWMAFFNRSVTAADLIDIPPIDRCPRQNVLAFACHYIASFALLLLIIILFVFY